VDGLRSQRSRLVWEFVRQQRGRLWVGIPSGLSIGVEPRGVFVGAHWKQHELPNFCPDNYRELSQHARRALCRMRRRPTLVCPSGSSSSHCTYIMWSSRVPFAVDSARLKS